MTEYKFKAKVWLYSGDAAWHFITVPKKESRSIKTLFGDQARGFGSLPIIVMIGSSRWKTSIFPESKSGSYMLPIKASVRKKENIKAGKSIQITIEIQV